MKEDGQPFDYTQGGELVEPQPNIVIYTTDDGQTKLQVKIEKETVWLAQKQMAELFQCSTDNIGLHLKNIFKEGELNENSVAEEYSVTASDGKAPTSA